MQFSGVARALGINPPICTYGGMPPWDFSNILSCILKHSELVLQCVIHLYTCTYIIKLDQTQHSDMYMRRVISCGKDQRLSEAEEVLCLGYSVLR